MPVYIGPWIWETTTDDEPHWQSPDGTVALLDVRNIDAQSQQGGTAGLGIFYNPDALPSEYEVYGELEDALPVNRRNVWKSQLNITGMNATTVWQAIEESITVRGDPAGENFAKPILPNHGGVMSLIFGPLRTRNELRKQPHLHAIVRETYRQTVLVAKAEGVAIDTLRKYAGAITQKIGAVDHMQLGFEEDETPIEPTTTVSDDFNRANAANLGANWTELVNGYTLASNAAQTNTAGADLARFDQDVASDDHYAEADVIAHSSTNPQPGVAARFSASAQTFYQAENRQATTKDQGIRKFISGSSTYIANSDTLVQAPTYTLRSQCDGSTISCILDGVVRAQATDTAITGNLRGGLRTYGGTSGTRFDDFEVTDLIASTNLRGRPRLAIYGR
jgi:hypothetical protein